ncbi:MAG: 30S ribosomal protein S17 [Thaumarchaeota archaeon]|nr:MAG: 30S ribosomal protein S17 [Thaumarchaeota archaeon 13_1_40CM_2_39_13_1]OLE40243.1 MAG: 30S ribosomal protein S17 [Thaumarchaeota archaeon 13_1_20CM_2_39_20]TLX93938.1 MAG: 30S ribosomal protein S17 [Nitrososphaerota archaeon]
MTKNIGLQVSVPKSECDDELCPFHGALSVRGKLVQGKIVSAKAPRMVVIQQEFPRIVRKYKRYARSQSKIHAHRPPCIDVKEGDVVLTAECRPISKSVSSVVVEVIS